MSMFPKFVIETIPPAKVAKPAKPDTDFSNISNFSKGVSLNNETANMQSEYFTLLRRFWEIDADQAATLDEARRLVIRLDELYRALHQAGRRVPVRLPVERTTRDAQRKLAL